MATIDPNIALQVRPVADPLEQYGKAVSLRSLGNQQRLQEAQLSQMEETQAQDRRLSDLYRQNVGGDGAINRQGLLSGAATAGLGSRIPGLQKGFAEQDKALGDARKTHIDNQGAALKLVGDTMSQLSANPNLTTQDVIQVLASMPPDLVPPERTAQLVRSLPNDPAALRRQLAAMGANAEARYKELTPEFKTIDAGNRVIPGQVVGGQFTAQGSPITKAPEGFVVGEGGGLSVDPGFQQAKLQLAHAGKPVTSVNVNTNKTLLNEVASGLGKQLDDGLNAASSASTAINSARSLRNVLGTGKVITGPGADFRLAGLQVANALGITGKDAEETLANTRTAIQNLAQGELTAAQSMKGQGAITDAERAMLKRAAGGDINLTAGELQALANTIERNATARITSHQANVQRLKNVPGGESLIPFYEAPQIPVAPQAAPAAPAAAATSAQPAQAPAWQQMYKSQAEAVNDARSALQRGADKAAVIQRLEAAGITNHGIR